MVGECVSLLLAKMCLGPSFTLSFLALLISGKVTLKRVRNVVSTLRRKGHKTLGAKRKPELFSSNLVFLFVFSAHKTHSSSPFLCYGWVNSSRI